MVGVGLVLGPGRLLAAQFDGALAGEVELLVLEQRLDLGHAGFDALEVDVVDRVGRVELAEPDVVVEFGAVLLLEAVDVLLGEEELVVIERVDVGMQQALGDEVVERMARVVELFERLGHGDGHLAGIGVGRPAGRQGRQQERTTNGQGERKFHHGAEGTVAVPGKLRSKHAIDGERNHRATAAGAEARIQRAGPRAGRPAAHLSSGIRHRTRRRVHRQFSPGLLVIPPLAAGGLGTGHFLV